MIRIGNNYCYPEDYCILLKEIEEHRRQHQHNVKETVKEQYGHQTAIITIIQLQHQIFVSTFHMII